VVHIIFVNFKGYGLLAIVIQCVIAFICICFGMVYESAFWGVPIIGDNLPGICFEIGLIISLPFLYMLQKWLDKKGRYEDSVYNHRPFKWGVTCCVFIGVVIVLAAVVGIVTGMR